MSYFNSVKIGQLTNYLRTLLAAVAEPVWMSSTGSIRQVDTVAAVTSVTNTIAMTVSTGAWNSAGSTAMMSPFEPMVISPISMDWQASVRSHIS